VTGDGTTSSVLFVGELLRQAERYVQEGLHPRVLVDGYEQSRQHVLDFVKEYQVDVSDKVSGDEVDRELLVQVASTSLRTKVHSELADHLTEIVVDAVLAIRQPNKPLDLHMIEMMHMVCLNVM
jgi:T-complex protein 1 subunit zeta